MRMEPVAHIEALFALAERFHESGASKPGKVTTLKTWCEPARTFTYHTHVAVPDVGRETLVQVSDTFFRAADLEEQPWYAQFRGGRSRPIDEVPVEGISRQQFALSSFDVGLRAPRCYRQLVCEAAPRPDTRIVSLRSVDIDWPIPDGMVLAVTLEPSGDVFEWRDGHLHWHHICTTPGVGLLPGALDRWFLNTLRRFGLDAAERTTYREEAEGFRDWVSQRL
jgi:hypothetical protein